VHLHKHIDRMLDRLECRDRDHGPAPAAEIAPVFTARSKRAYRVVMLLTTFVVMVGASLLIAKDHEFLSCDGGPRLAPPLVNVRLPLRLFIYAAPLITLSIYAFLLLQMHDLSRLLRRLGQMDSDTVDSHFLFPATEKGYVLGYWGIIGLATGPFLWLALWWRLARFQHGAIELPQPNDMPWATPFLLGYEFTIVLAVFCFWLERKLGARWLAAHGFLFKTRDHSVLSTLVVATVCVLPIGLAHASSSLDFRNAQISAPSSDNPSKSTGPSFRNANLAGVKFDGSLVAGADFTGADLRRSSWLMTNASNARFWSAKLQDAEFGKARVNGSDFMNAEVTNISFDHADMTGANLAGIHGSGAFFVQAQLDGVTFFNSNLPRAVFLGASMVKAYLSSSRLHQANFRFAQLRGAVFGPDVLPMRGGSESTTILTCADFSYAQMQDATMNEVVVDGAIFIHAHMAGMTIGEAVGNRLADSSDPPCARNPIWAAPSKEQVIPTKPSHGRLVDTPAGVNDDEAKMFYLALIAARATHWIEWEHITFVGGVSE